MNDGDPIKNDNFCDTFEVIKDIASQQHTSAANNLVFLVGNKTSLAVFATRELADRFVSNFGGATAGGMSITSVPVIGAFRNNAETMPLDWRNALTANLLIYGCGLTKTQIRAIIDFVIDGVEPPADLFATKSTSDMLDDRAEFEAYMSTQGWPESDLSDKCSRTGEYQSPRLRDDWKIWQARSAIASRQPTLSRSQKLAAAGFTARDTRITCDECGNKYTPQMLPVHKCRCDKNTEENDVRH